MFNAAGDDFTLSSTSRFSTAAAAADTARILIKA
jgi:hypothetical protein